MSKMRILPDTQKKLPDLQKYMLIKSVNSTKPQLFFLSALS